ERRSVATSSRVDDVGWPHAKARSSIRIEELERILHEAEPFGARHVDVIDEPLERRLSWQTHEILDAGWVDLEHSILVGFEYPRIDDRAVAVRPRHGMSPLERDGDRDAGLRLFKDEWLRSSARDDDASARFAARRRLKPGRFRARW